MKDLYIHIGAHRTATSSIQQFMADNFRGLMERGYLYPFGVRRHFKFINRLLSEGGDIEKISLDLNKRMMDKPHEIHSMVLSDEDICMRRDLAKLSELREHFNVKIVYCLRRQDLWLESWYLQNIKWQWDPKLSHMPFDAFVETRKDYFWIDYQAYITQLEDLFGVENVNIYVFERDQMPEGPIAAFAKQIKLNDIEGLGQAPNKNFSLSPLTSEFMRCLPLDKAIPRHRALLEQACAKMDRRLREEHPNSGTRSTLLLGHAQRREIMDEYAQGNMAVAKRYFDRDVLFFEPLPDTNAEVADLALPSDSYELMQNMVAPFVKELNKIYSDRENSN